MPNYEELDRVSKVQYYNNETSENVTYGYLYSSNGRVTLYTDHTYDTSDRILTQSWQIGEDGFSESYSYNEAAGTLKTMTTDGGYKY